MRLSEYPHGSTWFYRSCGLQWSCCSNQVVYSRGNHDTCIAICRCLFEHALSPLGALALRGVTWVAVTIGLLLVSKNSCAAILYTGFAGRAFLVFSEKKERAHILFFVLISITAWITHLGLEDDLLGIMVVSCPLVLRYVDVLAVLSVLLSGLFNILLLVRLVNPTADICTRPIRRPRSRILRKRGFLQIYAMESASQ